MIEKDMVDHSCFGSAAKVASEAIREHGGGRLVMFSSILPHRGLGVLSRRESPAILGTDAEVKLFTPSSSFYKELAEFCCINGVGVSIYAPTNGYVDLASIGKMFLFQDFLQRGLEEIFCTMRIFHSKSMDLLYQKMCHVMYVVHFFLMYLDGCVAVTEFLHCSILEILGCEMLLISN